MGTKVVSKAASAAELERADALRRFKAGVFQVLGHPTRIHIVEILRKGEVPVSKLLEEIGVEPANLSQHLTVLRSKGLVVNRKNGNQVLYALRDPMLVGVLETMKRYFQADLQAAMSILRIIEQERK
jgi:DNA-binding transcriptional ArsR family regulator